jgi:protease I
MKELMIYALFFGVVSAIASNMGEPNRQDQTLKGKRIAILVADGFEHSELHEPRKALIAAGAITTVVSPQRDQVKSWKDKDWGEPLAVDQLLSRAKAGDYDALLLPGGTMNPDALRMNDEAVQFVKAFVQAMKPVAAICHGPWTLVDADAVRGKKMTSWPSLRADLRNAGAEWIDAEVVVDQGLVTSRKPADLPAFNREMIRMFAREK